MSFEFMLDPETQRLYLNGFLLTIKLLLGSIFLSFVLAIPMAVARNSRIKAIKNVVWSFTYVLRGTPLLLQLYLIYYGLAQFQFIRESAAWCALSSPLFCAFLAFTMNELAYTTEIFAGAIRGLPYGEIEAAYAYGMGPFTILRRIILPLALRRSLPAYSNEVVILLHSTSLVTTITLLDLTGAANEIYARYYLPFEAFMVAAVVYMTLTYCIVRMFRAAEIHFLAYQRPQQSNTPLTTLQSVLHKRWCMGKSAARILRPRSSLMAEKQKCSSMK